MKENAFGYCRQMHRYLDICLNMFFRKMFYDWGNFPNASDDQDESNFALNRYDEAGNSRGIPRFNAFKPIKLKWAIPESVGGECWPH